jgi:hypothetical protein
MNTQLEDAFVDSPPFGLREFSTKTLMLVQRALSYAGLKAEDADFIGAYICVSNGKTRPTESEVIHAFSDTPDSDLHEIMSYIVRVRQRQTEAAVEVADTPGKSDT